MDVNIFLYIPISGDISPLITNIKSFKMKTSSPLAGLSHKGISLTIYETHNAGKVDMTELYPLKDPRPYFNTKATKIFLYLMNPSMIYSGTEVLGDAVLKVSIHSDSPYISEFQGTNRAQHLVRLKEIIECIYAEKSEGKMPKDLELFLSERLKKTQLRIDDAKKGAKDVSGLDKIKEHIIESMSLYGKIKLLG